MSDAVIKEEKAIRLIDIDQEECYANTMDVSVDGDDLLFLIWRGSDVDGVLLDKKQVVKLMQFLQEYV